jgi:hypothetical protein
MKKVIIALSFLFLNYSSPLWAQGPGFEDDTEDTVPLDGGLSLLAAAGVGYGIKKLKDAKKKKDTVL